MNDFDRYGTVELDSKNYIKLFKEKKKARVDKWRNLLFK